MLRIVNRHGARDGWLRNIENTAGHERPCLADGTANGQFPWVFLKADTNAYLHKKGRLSQEERDVRLIALIKACGNKPVALAAAGHALSINALESILHTDLNCPLGDEAALPDYLQLLFVISQVNPSAVSQRDGMLARLLIPCVTGNQIDGMGRKMAIIAQAINYGITKETLVYNHVDALLNRYCRQLNNLLKELVTNGRFFAAANEIGWLVNFADANGNLPPGTLLGTVIDKNLPDWHAWAVWKPNLGRLRRWQVSFTARDTNLLRGIFALEGPVVYCPDCTKLSDHYLHLYRSIREPQPGVLHIGPLALPLDGTGPTDAQELMDLLLAQVDRIAGTEALCQMQLVPYIRNENLTESHLRILEATADLNNLQVLQIIVGLDRLVPTENIASLLPHLIGDEWKDLRRLLLPQLKAWTVQRWDSLVGKVTKMIRFGNDPPSTGSKLYFASDLLLKWLQELQEFGELVKRTTWLVAELDINSQDTLGRWPCTQETTAWLTLYKYARETGVCTTLSDQDGQSDIKREVRRSLLQNLGVYISCRFTPGMETKIAQSSASYLQPVQTLMWTFDRYTDDSHAALALLATQRALFGRTHSIVSDCLEQICSLSTATVKALLQIFQKMESQKPNVALCAQVATLLCSSRDMEATSCWNGFLVEMIEELPSDFLEVAFDTLKVGGLFEFINNLATIFLQDAKSSNLNPLLFGGFHPHRLLSKGLHAWFATLAPHIEVLDWMGQFREMDAVTLRILALNVKDDTQGFRSSVVSLIGYIGEVLEVDVYRQQLLCRAIIRCAQDGCIKFSLGSLCQDLTRKTLGKHVVSDEVVDAALEVIIMFEESLQVGSRVAQGMCEAQLTGLILSEVSTAERGFLVELEKFLELETDDIDDAAIDMLGTDFQDEVVKLLKEAERLEGLRLALRKCDPDWTVKVLDTYGIEHESALSLLTDSLPSELIDIVEQIDDRQLEMQIPLDMTNFQKMAMGIPNARNLLVRLVIDQQDTLMPPAFCVHFDGDDEESGLAEVLEHSPWICWAIRKTNPAAALSLPSRAYCQGRANLAMIQVSRALARHLADGFSSIPKVYDILRQTLDTFAQVCIGCGVANPAYLGKRASHCGTTKCRAQYSYLTAEVQLSSIRHDPAVVDLLLSMAHSVTLSGNTSSSSSSSGGGSDMILLPNCPSTTLANVTSTLQLLQPIQDLQRHKALDELFTHNDPTRKFLSWLLNSFGGYLISATGQLRLPGLPPKVHQFVLASAAPALETAFAAQVKASGGTTRALFHGTTFERLYSILTQGLQSKSGTSWAQNGAAFGHGIYLAEEIATAYSYANVHSAATVGKNWKHGRFCAADDNNNNGAGFWPLKPQPLKDGGSIRVVLGVELAGASSPASTGIHVIADPSRVMVRYIFVMPPSITCPVSRHVTPAMESVFAGLRAGTI